MPENRSRCARVRDSRFRVRAPARAYKAAEPAVRGARAPHGVNMTPSTVYQKVFRAEDGLSYTVSRIYERWFEQLAKHAAACSRAHAVSVRTPYAPLPVRAPPLPVRMARARSPTARRAIPRARLSFRSQNGLIRRRCAPSRADFPRPVEFFTHFMAGICICPVDVNYLF
jgi:hypothetical protein